MCLGGRDSHSCRAPVSMAVTTAVHTCDRGHVHSGPTRCVLPGAAWPPTRLLCSEQYSSVHRCPRSVLQPRQAQSQAAMHAFGILAAHRQIVVGQRVLVRQLTCTGRCQPAGCCKSGQAGVDTHRCNPGQPGRRPLVVASAEKLATLLGTGSSQSQAALRAARRVPRGNSHTSPSRR